jgi:acetyl-CoA C-acetyltransferase
MKEVFIVSAVRTPIGSFGGALASVPATKLGAVAIEGAIKKAGIDANEIDEVFMGNVLQANEGQAPARQAALFAGVPNNVPCTTINKVCASGMKSIMFAAQSILLGDNDVVVAGGMENMSQVPHYVNMRDGIKLGNGKIIDGMVNDGLWDVYNNFHMGNAGEICAKEYNFTREEQDAVAIASYERAAAAWSEDNFKDEIVPVTVSTRKGDIVVSEDEEYKNVKFEKIPTLRPVFQKDGTITAANASTLNDGASALVLMSGEKVKELGLTPIAKVVGYGDAAGAPEWFTTAPAKALPKALKKAGLKLEDIEYYELNEAFAVVPMAAMKELNLSADKVNVWGSGCSLGHPLGNTGSRITVTLISVLRKNKARYGAASLCNGGGGASALIIEAL